MHKTFFFLLNFLIQLNLIYPPSSLNPPSMFFILSTVIHQILLETIPTWNLIIRPISLSSFLLLIFPSLPISTFSNVGMAAVRVCCGLKVEGVFSFPLFSLPTYTAHLRGWTWWQPPPPRCRPCSSSGPPAPAGCSRCAVSHCRWMFPETCLKRCLPSLSTAPEQRGEGETTLREQTCC